MTSPKNLDYGEETLLLVVGQDMQALTPSFTGDGPQNWLVNPRLPDGLTLDAESGVISGTPEIELMSTSFTIIATNAVGSSVFIIDIQILPAPPDMISYGDNVIFCTLNQFCGINNPMTSGGEIEGWDIIPNLPDGLEILDNGEISGVIRQLVDSNYTITASNSGGSGSECSGDLRTNVYANTPSAISVAALTHDGTAVTSFSSRGCMNQQHTWPDVGAPGRDIWATAPRGTAIDASTRTQGDLYYMSISGTSMATPHVGGMAGLLLNVAPSLGVADYHRDDHDFGSSLVGGDGTAAYGQFEDWDEANFSRVHEIELILELTARYDGMANSCEDGNDEDSCSDIPTECYVSATGKCHDWRVGHGLTDTDAAVALARTLQLMRDQDHDGIVDHPEYNVWDAYEIYQEMMVDTTIPVNTDRVRHSWKGDWNHFNNGATGAVYYTEDAHYVWIPNGTSRLEATFTATEFDSDTVQAGALQLSIDLAEDGSNDAQGAGIRQSDSWYYDLDVDESAWGQWAEFDISGQAVTVFGFIEDIEFFESRIPYTVDVMLTLDLSQAVDIQFDQRPDFYSDLNPTSPSDMYDASMDGMLTFTKPAYDQAGVISLIVPKETRDRSDSDGLFASIAQLFTDNPGTMIFILLLILLSAGGAGYAMRNEKGKIQMAILEEDESEGEIEDDES